MSICNIPSTERLTKLPTLRHTAKSECEWVRMMLSEIFKELREKNNSLNHNLISVNTWICSLSLSASFLSHSLIRFFNRSSVSSDNSDPPVLLQSSSSTSRLEIFSRNLDQIQGYCVTILERDTAIWKVATCGKIYFEKVILEKRTFPIHN